MKLWKRAGVAGLLAIILGGGAGSALAQGSDLKVTLGLKLWVNEWETAITNDSPETGTNVIQTTRSRGYFPTVSPIPSLTVRYKDFFVSGGYFIRTNYSFPNFSQVVNIGGAPFTATTAASASRDEVDLSLGYFIVPQVALSVGYKVIKQRYTLTTSGPGLLTTTGTSTTDNRALFAGAAASAPIGGGFNLYGNAALGPMRTSFTGGGSSLKGYFASAETGIAYPLGTNTVMNLAYKFQILDLAFAGQRARDTTNGILLGMSYTF